MMWTGQLQECVRYTATERFTFLGFIKWDNPIAVELFTDDSARVGKTSKSPGGVRMACRFDLSAEGTGTRMEDALDLSAPSLIIRYAAARGRKVQLARARILAEDWRVAWEDPSKELQMIVVAQVSDTHIDGGPRAPNAPKGSCATSTG